LQLTYYQAYGKQRADICGIVYHNGSQIALQLGSSKAQSMHIHYQFLSLWKCIWTVV